MIEAINDGLTKSLDFSKGFEQLNPFAKEAIWIEPLINLDVYSDLGRTNFLPTHGEWTGDKGNSDWKPDLEKTPDPENKKRGNPENLTWGEILEKYNVEGITFNEGEPDFSEVAVGEVKIKDFTESRQKNFYQADTLLAEQWTDEEKNGKSWSPREVADYRKENHYTWHECKDCQTLQLVPTEVHNNIPHVGGICEIKKANAS